MHKFIYHKNLITDVYVCEIVKCLKHKYANFYARLQICEMRLLASSCLSVCLSIRMEQLGSYRIDFREIWYLIIFRKSVKKIQVLLHSDKNNGYFTWRHLKFVLIPRS